MTTKSRTPAIRGMRRAIQGIAPAPRATATANPGMGFPAAVSAPRAPASAAAPTASGAVAHGAQVSQAAPPTDLRRLKNSDLRGKIAKLERDNKILAAQLAELRASVGEIADELDDKMLSRRHDQPLLDTAFRLRRVIT